MVGGDLGVRTAHAQGLVVEEWNTEADNVTIQRKFLIYDIICYAVYKQFPISDISLHDSRLSWLLG